MMGGNQSNKPIWMTHKALKLVKHRHKIFRKYKDPHHPACMKANKQASRAVRDSRKSFEFKQATKIEEDKKSFIAYVGSKAKSRIKVGPLVDSDGKESSDTSDIAEALNEQFASVFTEEDLAKVPVAENLFQTDLGANWKLLKLQLKMYASI